MPAPLGGRPGRSSASMFKSLTAPDAQGHFNEASHLKTVVEPRHRHTLRSLRMGLVRSKCELTKGYRDGEGQPYRQSNRSGYVNNLTCECGHGAQDSQHFVLECPHSLHKRCRLHEAVEKAVPRGALKNTVQRLQPDELLRVALGGPLPHQPWAIGQRRWEAAEIMATAAPTLHEIYGDDVSIPYDKPY